MKKKKVSKETRKKISDAAKARHAKARELKGKSVEVVVINETDDFKYQLNFECPKPSKDENISAKSSCRRHPDVTFPIGASCQKCKVACLRYNAVMANKTFILPCPNCKASTQEEDGGCIKTFYSKADHYSCGHCKISYNLKGEKVTWESGKDEQLFNREILHRK